MKSQVNETKKNVNDVIAKLNKAIENLDKFYAIHNEILDGYNDDNINYEAAQNLSEINNSISNEIFQLNEMDNGYNINKLLYISNEIEGNNIEIELNYKINKNSENNEGGEGENTIKILGSQFVEKNSNLCQIIRGSQKEELKEKMYLFDDKEKDIFTIKLRGINNDLLR